MKNNYYTLQEIIEGYTQKSFTPADVFDHYYNRHQQIEVKHGLNSVITQSSRETTEKAAAKQPQPIPIGHKDIYSTQNIRTTAASNILADYIPPYSATSVKRLESAGLVGVVKLNCDAFAHGATGENSDFGPTKNPYALNHTPGGSSSGSAAAVAAGIIPAATATDTGGSIRFPASLTNTVGLKPTYGRASRYGVIAMTSSTDSIGHITRTVWDSAYLLNITAGQDPLDATTSNRPTENYLAQIEQGIKNLRIGIPKEYTENIDPKIMSVYEKALTDLEKLGAELVPVSLPHTKDAISAYYIITPSEISSNLGRFDGIRYGMDRSAFGAEAKRRIMIGTFCLSAGYYDAYYLKAQQVRTLVIQDFQKVFEQVDLLVTPVSPTLTPKLGEAINDPIKNYMLDVLMVTANLAGIPGLSVPAGFVGSLPVGIQFLGNHFDEHLLFQAGYAYEQHTQYYQREPEFKEI